MATIKSKDSYNGSFINFDNNTDYQALINKASKTGDLKSAAAYEAQRNAKLNYLGQANQATNNYVSVYSKSPTNNQGGTIYDNNTKNFTSLPTDWTKASVNGITYKNDGGNISQLSGKQSNGIENYSLVGTGVNPTTGEFTLDAENAKKNYLASMYSYNGGKYTDVDESYLSALQGGTTGQWTNDLVEKTKAENEEKRLAALAAIGDNDNRRSYKTVEEIPEEELLLIDDDNSFETDTNDYLKTRLRSFTRGW